MIVPWVPGDPARERLWAYCRARWEAAGFEVVEGSDERGLWACRNEGARAAGVWDAAVFADADVALADPAQARAALAKAAAENAYVAAYSQLVMLSRAATEAVVGGGSLGGDAAHVWYGVWIGCYAIGRALFDELGGYDERFAPWAGQDIAIIQAAATLGGLDRVQGTAYHLWHPSAPARGRQPGEGTGDLWPRYTAATGNPEAMRELLRR